MGYVRVAWLDYVVFGWFWVSWCLNTVGNELRKKVRCRVIGDPTWSRIPSGVGVVLQKPTRFQNFPETRESAPRRARDSRLCVDRWRFLSSAASRVSGRSCPRLLFPRVHFSFGRTWSEGD